MTTDYEWMTYVELSQLHGTTPQNARQHALRVNWDIKYGDDGRVLVKVPTEVDERTAANVARCGRLRIIAAIEAGELAATTNPDDTYRIQRTELDRWIQANRENGRKVMPTENSAAAGDQRELAFLRDTVSNLQATIDSMRSILIEHELDLAILRFDLLDGTSILEATKDKLLNEEDYHERMAQDHLSSAEFHRVLADKITVDGQRVGDVIDKAAIVRLQHGIYEKFHNIGDKPKGQKE
jgi:hypothetical protein